MIRLPRSVNRLLLLSLLLYTACKPNTGDTDDVVTNATHHPGASSHNALTDDQLEKVKRIHFAFDEVAKITLTETIDKFKRYSEPDREIAIWLTMATAYERFAINKHVEEYDKKKEAFELLILRSKASEKEVLEKHHFEYLSNEEVQEIFDYYSEQSSHLR
ncbi:hypothetical protein WBG78_03780 [Chryseolinea sp. T2]|uniref:hypothetical protein n=1 Tax=Chryseolinea sp. T2 TaxID=3129255 RepID=UPI00307816A4